MEAVNDVSFDKNTMCRASRPVLSIGLLVSNRKDTIRRCLDSLTPIRESIPCELIITDTGCDEDLRQLLEQYADKLNDFVWCADFAKARNANLALAEGEWYLYLDDDEWFTDTTAIIHFFKEDDYNSYSDAVYIQRNYDNMEGTEYSDSWVSRMARIVPGIHFVSKVHEYMTPLEGNRIGLESVVDHYGYVFSSEEECRKHFERNSELVFEMIRENPHDLRMRMQLLLEYKFMKMYDELFSFGEESMAFVPDQPDINGQNALVAFYAAMIVADEFRGQYEEEYFSCVRAERDTRCTETGRAFFAIRRAESCLHLEKWDEAAAAASIYFEKKRLIGKNPAQGLVESAPPFAGKCFAKNFLRLAHSVAAIAAIRRGKLSGLCRHIEEIGWDTNDLFLYNGILGEIMGAMRTDQSAKDLVELKGVMRILYRNNYLWRIVCDDIAAGAAEEEAGTTDGEDTAPASSLTPPLAASLDAVGAREEVQSYIAMRRAEQSLIDPKGMTLEALRKDFSDFSGSCVRFYEDHYGKEIWEGEPESLDPEAQAALWIQLALEQESQSAQQFLACLKQCVRVYPTLAKGIGAWLGAWQEKQL